MRAFFLAVVLGTVVYACDVTAVSVTGFVVLVILLPAAGFLIGSPRALLLGVAVIVGLLVSDVLWQLDFAPYDRADIREPLPATLAAVLYVPIAILLVAAGLGIRSLRDSGRDARRGRRGRR